MANQSSQCLSAGAEARTHELRHATQPPKKPHTPLLSPPLDSNKGRPPAPAVFTGEGPVHAAVSKLRRELIKKDMHTILEASDEVLALESRRIAVRRSREPFRLPLRLLERCPPWHYALSCGISRCETMQATTLGPSTQPFGTISTAATLPKYSSSTIALSMPRHRCLCALPKSQSYMQSSIGLRGNCL
jgi:hypothetical protein